MAYGYGLFTGGLGAHDGGTLLGATVVPASAGNTNRQLTLIKDFGADTICCTPSYAVYLADEFKKAGIPTSELKGVAVGEPENLRCSVTEKPPPAPAILPR